MKYKHVFAYHLEKQCLNIQLCMYPPSRDNTVFSSHVSCYLSTSRGHMPLVFLYLIHLMNLNLVIYEMNRKFISKFEYIKAQFNR